MQKSYFKKIIYFLTICAILIISVNNKLLSQFEAGIKAGLSFNSVNNKNFFFESENMSHNVFEKNNGYRFGFYTKLKLIKSFFIQPEIYYSYTKKKIRFNLSIRSRKFYS